MKTMKVVIWCAIGAFVVGVSANAALISNTPTHDTPTGQIASQDEQSPTLLASPEQHDIEQAGKRMAFMTACSGNIDTFSMAMLMTALDQHYGKGTGEKALQIMKSEAGKAVAADAAKRSIFDENSWCKNTKRELGL